MGKEKGVSAILVQTDHQTERTRYERGEECAWKEENAGQHTRTKKDYGRGY